MGRRQRPHRPETLAHLLKYDSIYGPYPGTVDRTDERDRSSTARRSRSSPSATRPTLPWGDLGVDVVIESTGLFTKREDAAEAPRRGRAEGDHLRAGHRPGRDGRARRQLRRRLRRRQAPHHLQRVVHDELPRAGRQGAARDVRHREGPDDDDPRLHGRPAPAGHAAQGPAPRPRRRDQPDPRLDRRGQGGRARDARAQGQAAPASRSARPCPPARSSTSPPCSRARRRRRRSTRRSRRRPTPAPFEGILRYIDDPIVSSDIVKSTHSSIFDAPLTVGAGRDARQGRRLVRQRVGLLEPLCRARAARAGACARLTTSTSRASASSSGWTSTSRWTTAAITDDARIRGALPDAARAAREGRRAARPARAPRAARRTASRSSR